MKKTFRSLRMVIPLFAALLLLSGCPYSSSVPLSESTMKIPDSFIGEWELSGASDGDKVIVRRTSVSTVDIIKVSGVDNSETTYAGHLTDINGELFLNLKESGDFGSFYFYKLKRDGDFKITLLPVTSYIRETFESSEEMKKFFEKNSGNSYFYTTDEETYYKTK